MKLAGFPYVRLRRSDGDVLRASECRIATPIVGKRVLNAKMARSLSSTVFRDLLLA